MGVLISPPAVHLAQHYLHTNKKDGDLKAIVLIGSMGAPKPFNLPSNLFVDNWIVNSVVGCYCKGSSILSVEARHLGPNEIYQ